MQSLLQDSMELLVQIPFTQLESVKPDITTPFVRMKAMAILNMLSRACGVNPMTANVMEHFLSWTIEKKLLRPNQVPHEIRLHVAAARI